MPAHCLFSYHKQHKSREIYKQLNNPQHVRSANGFALGKLGKVRFPTFGDPVDRVVMILPTTTTVVKLGQIADWVLLPQSISMPIFAQPNCVGSAHLNLFVCVCVFFLHPLLVKLQLHTFRTVKSLKISFNFEILYLFITNNFFQLC